MYHKLVEHIGLFWPNAQLQLAKVDGMYRFMCVKSTASVLHTLREVDLCKLEVLLDSAAVVQFHTDLAHLKIWRQANAKCMGASSCEPDRLLDIRFHHKLSIDQAVLWGETTALALCDFYDKFLMSASGKLVGMCPSMEVMNNPQLLKNPEQKKQIRKNNKKEDISGKVRQVKTFKDRFEELAKKGASLVSKDTLENARAAIRHGKVAVATNWGLDKIGGIT